MFYQIKSTKFISRLEFPLRDPVIVCVLCLRARLWSLRASTKVGSISDDHDLRPQLTGHPRPIPEPDTSTRWLFPLGMSYDSGNFPSGSDTVTLNFYGGWVGLFSHTRETHPETHPKFFRNHSQTSGFGYDTPLHLEVPYGPSLGVGSLIALWVTSRSLWGPRDLLTFRFGETSRTRWWVCTLRLLLGTTLFVRVWGTPSFGV